MLLVSLTTNTVVKCTSIAAAALRDRPAPLDDAVRGPLRRMPLGAP